MSRTDSPYVGVKQSEWKDVTLSLIDSHPLDSETIVRTVLEAWNAIFHSKLGARGFQIGVHIHPKPQIIGFLLHELIPLELESEFPGLWRGEKSAGDKDLVYVPDPSFSIELKTSSHPTKIFGNRSYAQEATSTKKSKSGFYLAVNFQKFDSKIDRPEIGKIRFGWLDNTDWVGQKSQTGQQASLDPIVERTKLLTLYASE